MGSSFSRGRKYSPTKNVLNKSVNIVAHAKFNSCDAPTENTEYVEGVVCKEEELKENEMKVCTIGHEDNKILIIKQKGEISALGHKCTHYGAPLVNGHLGNGRIRCQWHGACFNINNGDIEDFPGLDSLPCYEVRISNGDVIVRASKKELQSNKRVKSFLRSVDPEKGTFLVVGGGPAGATCVENLRTLNFYGRIIFILGEKYLPYDRIKLSKALDVQVENITLRQLEFYQERNVEIKFNVLLENLNPSQNTATLSNGETIKYDKIFLATGSSPRKLRVPGRELKNIFYLRTAEDAKEIRAALNENSNVVILGTSFIGMETAAYCADKVKSVTVIGRDIPFKGVFGKEIGNRIMKLFQEKNVQFQLYQSISGFEGDNGKLTTVVLTDRLKLPADVCLIGIGASANTGYLIQSGIKFQNNCSIEVNEFLETQFPNVYAGGDIAYAPVLGQKANIGHWGLASYHGHTAAYNMLDQKKPLKAVPFFWTMLFGKGFRYTGFATSFDDTVIDGSVEDLQFIAFHCSGKYVVAVTTANRDPLAAKFAETLYENKKLQKSKITEWLS